MTLDQLQRAQLLLFAHQEAACTGSLDAMKAVCYVIRNRVRGGWHDGSWIDVMENAYKVGGNHLEQRQHIDPYNRIFQMLMQSVDDIYYSSASDQVENVVGDALYYQFADRSMRAWFEENIIRYPAAHARKAQIGMMVLFK